MAKISIPGLVPKKTARGISWYWQPSATQKKAGWVSRPLGKDEGAAIAAARARNAEIAAWRDGTATPAGVAAIEKQHTVDAVIAEFKLHRFPKLKEKTAVEYASKLRTISKWAGTENMASITRSNILQLRDVLYAPRPDGEIRATTAFNTLKVLRTLWDWAKRNEKIPVNPAEGDLDISTPEPRQQFASDLCQKALIDSALSRGRVNMAAAMILAWTIGQRQEDLLKMLQSRYDEIQPYEADDPAVYARLASREPDGRVMGIRMRQGKTDRWVGVPVVGEARVQIEAAIAASRKLGLTTILHDEKNERPWTSSDPAERRTRQTQFQFRFNRIRLKAAATLTAAGDTELAAEVADIEFRDFRRTCVVTMGQRGIPDHLISAITGHRLESVKKILETYLPRTTGMAMLAIDLSHDRAPRPIVRPAKSA